MEQETNVGAMPFSGTSKIFSGSTELNQLYSLIFVHHYQNW